MHVACKSSGLLGKTLRLENIAIVLLWALIENLVGSQTLELVASRFSSSMVRFRSLHHFAEVVADLLGRSRTSHIRVVRLLDASIVSLILLLLFFIVILVIVIFLVHIVLRGLVEEASQVFELHRINLPTARNDADRGLSCVLSIVLGNDAKIGRVNRLQLLLSNLDFMLQVHTPTFDSLHLLCDELTGEARCSGFKLGLDRLRRL